MASVGLAVAMLYSGPLIAPEKAEALSYQERMAALEQRRQQLEATKAEACAPSHLQCYHVSYWLLRSLCGAALALTSGPKLTRIASCQQFEQNAVLWGLRDRAKPFLSFGGSFGAQSHGTQILL